MKFKKDKVYFINYVGQFDYDSYVGTAKYTGDEPERIDKKLHYLFEIVINGKKSFAYFPEKSINENGK